MITALSISLLLIAGITYFYQNIQSRKRTEQMDLYTLIASDPEIVIRLNRPQIASSLILSHKETAGLVSSVPEVFLSLIRQSPSGSSPLLSVHPGGILFYTKAEDKTLSVFEKQVFKRLFPSYPPTVEKQSEISYFYYPDTAGRFFGYYHHDGVLVAGYNLKGLEEVAARQLGSNSAAVPLNGEIYASDSHAPVNLFLSAAKLGLHFALNDSVSWHSGKEWLVADLFSNEGKVCCYGSLELPQPLDSLYLSLAADTLARQLEQLFPTLRIESQLSQEDKWINYTGCTVNPS